MPRLEPADHPPQRFGPDTDRSGPDTERSGPDTDRSGRGGVPEYRRPNEERGGADHGAGFGQGPGTDHRGGAARPAGAGPRTDNGYGGHDAGLGYADRQGGEPAGTYDGDAYDGAGPGHRPGPPQPPGVALPSGAPRRRAGPGEGEQGARRPAAALLALAAVAVAVSAVLPWSELSSGDETRTLSGMAVGDGRLTGLLALGLVWVGCAALAGRRAFAADLAAARLAAAGIVVVSAFDVVFGPPTLASVRGISAEQIMISPQVGVLASLAGGIVALLAAVLLRRR